MNFNIEDKIQLVKWHFGGKSLSETAELFTKTYGRSRTKKAVYRVIYLFQKRGCLNTTCKKCSSILNKAKVDDEIEALEIMVCAAAELELSNRDIALELGIYPHKVAKILKKHGYGIFDSEGSEEEEFGDIKRPELRPATDANESLEEAHWEEKKQIVIWSYGGSKPAAISRQFTNTFRHGKPTKAWIQHIIQLFDKCGCIRDCKQCVGMILKPKDIAEDSGEDIDIDEAPVSANGKIKAEDNSSEDSGEDIDINEAPVSVNGKIKAEDSSSKILSKFASDNIDKKCAESISKTERIEELCKTESNNKRLRSSTKEEDIEFISVKPTMDVVVIGKIKSKKKKKKVE